MNISLPVHIFDRKSFL